VASLRDDHAPAPAQAALALTAASRSALTPDRAAGARAPGVKRAGVKRAGHQARRGGDGRWLKPRA
jgi:hypothetical protein